MDILLILLHTGRQIQPRIETHGDTTVYIKGVTQDLLLPVNIKKLVDIAVEGAALEGVFASRQRPDISKQAGRCRRPCQADGVGGKQIGAALALTHAVVVAHAVAVCHTLELAAGKLGQQTGILLRRLFIPAVQQHIDVADVGLLIAGAEQCAALVAASHKTGAVLSVDVAVLQNTAVGADNGVKPLAFSLCHQIAAQLHDKVAQNGAVTVEVANQGFIDIRDDYHAVGADDQILHQPTAGIVDEPSGVDIIRNIGVIVHQIAKLGAKAQSQEVTGILRHRTRDHMTLEVNRTVEGRRSPLILIEVADHQNVGIAVLSLRRQQLPVV